MSKFMILIFVGLVAIAAFIGFLAFSWRADVSTDPRFAPYIGQPLIIQGTCQLNWHADKNMYRFKAYSLAAHQKTSTQSAEVKTVKTLRPGDVVVFREAKSYYSIFVGTVYYLIGKETLPDGEEIEFEYYAQFNYSPAAWETPETFVERRQRERASGQ